MKEQPDRHIVSILKKLMKERTELRTCVETLVLENMAARSKEEEGQLLDNLEQSHKTRRTSLDHSSPQLPLESLGIVSFHVTSTGIDVDQ